VSSFTIPDAIMIADKDSMADRGGRERGQKVQV